MQTTNTHYKSKQKYAYPVECVVLVCIDSIVTTNRVQHRTNMSSVQCVNIAIHSKAQLIQVLQRLLMNVIINHTIAAIHHVGTSFVAGKQC
jgi:hypothetical protein